MDIIQMKSTSEYTEEAMEKVNETELACCRNMQKSQELLDQFDKESSDFEALGIRLSTHFESIAHTEDLILPQELTVLKEKEHVNEENEEREIIENAGISFCGQTSFSPSVYEKTFNNNTCLSDCLFATPVSMLLTENDTMVGASPLNLSERRIDFAGKTRRRNTGRLFKLTDSILKDAENSGIDMFSIEANQKTATDILMDEERSIEYDIPVSNDRQADSLQVLGTSVNCTVVETSSVLLNNSDVVPEQSDSSPIPGTSSSLETSMSSVVTNTDSTLKLKSWLSSDHSATVPTLVPYDETVLDKSVKPTLVPYEELTQILDELDNTVKPLVQYDETQMPDYSDDVKRSLVPYDVTVAATSHSKDITITTPDLVPYPETMLDDSSNRTQLKGLVGYEETFDITKKDDRSRLVSYPDTMLKSPNTPVFSAGGLVECEEMVTLTPSTIDGTSSPLVPYDETTAMSVEQTPSVIEKTKSMISLIHDTPMLEKSKSDTMQSSWKRSLIVSTSDELSGFANPNDTCIDNNRMRNVYEKHLDDELDYFNPNQTGAVGYSLRSKRQKLQKKVGPVSKTLSTATIYIPEEQSIQDLKEKEEQEEILKEATALQPINSKHLSESLSASSNSKVDFCILSPEKDNVSLLNLNSQSFVDKTNVETASTQLAIEGKEHAQDEESIDMKSDAVQSIEPMSLSGKVTFMEPLVEHLSPSVSKNDSKRRLSFSAVKKPKPVKKKRKKKRILLTMPKDSSKRQRCTIDSKYNFESYSKARSYKNSPSNMQLRKLQCLSQTSVISSAKSRIRNKRKAKVANQTPLNSGVRKSKNNLGRTLSKSTDGEVSKRLELTPNDEIPLNIAECSSCSSGVDVSQNTPGTPLANLLCQNCMCTLKEKAVITKRRDVTQITFNYGRNKSVTSPHRAIQRKQKSQLGPSKLTIDTLAEKADKSSVSNKNNSRAVTRAHSSPQVTARRSLRQRKPVDYSDKTVRRINKNKDIQSEITASDNAEVDESAMAVPQQKRSNEKDKSPKARKQVKAITTHSVDESKEKTTKKNSGSKGKPNKPKESKEGLPHKKQLSIVDEGNENESTNLEKNQMPVAKASKIKTSGKVSRKRKTNLDTLVETKKSPVKSHQRNTSLRNTCQLRKRKNKDEIKTIGSPTKQAKSGTESENRQPSTSKANQEPQKVKELPDTKNRDSASSDSDAEIVLNLPEGYQHWSGKKGQRKSKVEQTNKENSNNATSDSDPPRRPKPFKTNKTKPVQFSVPAPPTRRPEGNEMKNSTQHHSSNGTVDESKLPGESTMSYLMRKKKKLFGQKGNKMKTPDSKERVVLNSTAITNRKSISTFEDVDISNIQGRPMDLSALTMNSRYLSSRQLGSIPQGYPQSLSTLLNRFAPGGKAKKM